MPGPNERRLQSPRHQNKHWCIKKTSTLGKIHILECGPDWTGQLAFHFCAAVTPCGRHQLWATASLQRVPLPASDPPGLWGPQKPQGKTLLTNPLSKPCKCRRLPGLCSMSGAVPSSRILSLIMNPAKHTAHPPRLLGRAHGREAGRFPTAAPLSHQQTRGPVPPWSWRSHKTATTHTARRDPGMAWAPFPQEQTSSTDLALGDLPAGLWPWGFLKPSNNPTRGGR